MQNYSREPDDTDPHLNMDSYKEMEYKLHCLRSLVCDLLKANQELREALSPSEDKTSSE